MLNIIHHCESVGTSWPRPKFLPAIVIHVRQQLCRRATVCVCVPYDELSFPVAQHDNICNLDSFVIVGVWGVWRCMQHLRLPYLGPMHISTPYRVHAHTTNRTENLHTHCRITQLNNYWQGWSCSWPASIASGLEAARSASIRFRTKPNLFVIFGSGHINIFDTCNGPWMCPSNDSPSNWIFPVLGPFSLCGRH